MHYEKMNGASFLNRIESVANDLGGVFTTADLHQLAGAKRRETNQRAIQRLENARILSRASRGIYVRQKGFDLWKLAARLKPKAYLSMDTVLSKNGLVGPAPLNRLSLVALTRNETITFLNYRIDLFSINKNLFFGFSRNNGVLTADNEKAFLDLLYYHLRGYRFPIDPKAEVDTDKLNMKRLAQYLKQYKNPKFIRFVEGVLHG